MSRENLVARLDCPERVRRVRGEIFSQRNDKPTRLYAHEIESLNPQNTTP